MEDIFTNLKNKFKSGNIVIKFIYINIAVFLFIRLSFILLKLFNCDTQLVIDYLKLSSYPLFILYKPWTLITYMFVHYEFLHILFNMLWLYWFGNIFLTSFNERQLGGLYVMGGILGAITFVASYNLFPYFDSEVLFSSLIGASASVMAIVFAISFYRKEYTIELMFIGQIKLIYLALITLGIDLLAITSENAGGHIAHIGGALAGILFVHLYKSKGIDITNPINKTIDIIVNLFKPKPQFKITKNKASKRRVETDIEYNTRKQQEMRQIDLILEKIKNSGYESLSEDEKRKLFDASSK